MDKGIKSPFSLIFGILAGLVLNDFIKNSSTAIASSTSIGNAIPIIFVAIISGAWIFYTLYGTVVWLMVTEYKPKDVGLPSSDIFVKMVFLRFLEFLPFICLYDIVNTMTNVEVKLSKIAIARTITAPNVIEGVGLKCLQRLSIDIALILILWTVWSFFWELFSESSAPIPQSSCRIIDRVWSCICQARTLGLSIAGVCFLIYCLILKVIDDSTKSISAIPTFPNPPIPVSSCGLAVLVILTVIYCPSALVQNYPL